MNILLARARMIDMLLLEVVLAKYNCRVHQSLLRGIQQSWGNRVLTWWI